MAAIGKDSRGFTLFVEDNRAGGRYYWSNEMGGRNVIWDTSIVSEEMLLRAMAHEKGLTLKEAIASMDWSKRKTPGVNY